MLTWKNVVGLEDLREDVLVVLHQRPYVVHGNVLRLAALFIEYQWQVP